MRTSAPAASPTLRVNARRTAAGGPSRSMRSLARSGAFAMGPLGIYYEKAGTTRRRARAADSQDGATSRRLLLGLCAFACLVRRRRRGGRHRGQWLVSDDQLDLLAIE